MSLHNFIFMHRDEIIRRCDEKSQARCEHVTANPTADGGLAVFIDQLTDALAYGARPSVAIGRSALRHGHDLRIGGFTVSQVVHNYGDVCQAVTELAVEHKTTITVSDFQTLNRCLDDAIAEAVTGYARACDRDHAESPAARDNQHVGFLVHELRNLINTAMFAFEALRTGNVGMGGSTGHVLQRSLNGLRSLVSKSFAEMRLTRGIQRADPVIVSSFIEDIAAGAALEAQAARVALRVLPVDGVVAIAADRPILAAVIGNLLQNAFKFTRPHTAVTLRVRASEERVCIEVEDECGGLPRGAADLFRPFEQQSADRSGLGLGLAFSRQAVEAHHGRLYARNLPGHGCVFVVDLPRVSIDEGMAVSA